MKPQKKIKPSDLQKQAEELIRSGQMPTLDRLLVVVAEVRLKYRDKILEARKAG